MKKYIKLTIVLISFTVILIIALIDFSKKEKISISETSFFFDTQITITIYDYEGKEKELEKLIENAFEKCLYYENIFSKTIKTSDIYNFNNYNLNEQSFGKKVEISDDTKEIIEFSKKISSITNNAFDITLGNVIDLWDFKSLDKTIPSQDVINAELNKTGIDDINIETLTNGEKIINYLTSKNPYSSLDLGAVAKGYIADEIKEYLLKNNVTSAIINLGGNILMINNKYNKNDFKIGIIKPFSSNGEIITNFEGSNVSVVTSGSYERNFIKNNTLYHHILDPATGYPVFNNLYSVTIISESSVYADSLSTACFVLGLEEGLELVNSLDKTEAIFITNDYSIYKSEGILFDNKTNTYKEDK